jgi:hypothetical protein
VYTKAVAVKTLVVESLHLAISPTKNFLGVFSGRASVTMGSKGGDRGKLGYWRSGLLRSLALGFDR